MIMQNLLPTQKLIPYSNIHEGEVLQIPEGRGVRIDRTWALVDPNRGGSGTPSKTNRRPFLVSTTLRIAGKNLAYVTNDDFINKVNVSATVSYNHTTMGNYRFVMTATGDGTDAHCQIGVKVKQFTWVTASFKARNTGDHTSDIRFSSVEGLSSTDYGYLKSNGKRQTITFYANKSDTVYVGFLINKVSTADPGKQMIVEDFQLEYGKEATDFVIPLEHKTFSIVRPDGVAGMRNTFSTGKIWSTWNKVTLDGSENWETYTLGSNVIFGTTVLADEYDNSYKQGRYSHNLLSDTYQDYDSFLDLNGVEQGIAYDKGSSILYIKDTSVSSLSAFLSDLASVKPQVAYPTKVHREDITNNVYDIEPLNGFTNLWIGSGYFLDTYLVYDINPSDVPVTLPRYNDVIFNGHKLSEFGVYVSGEGSFGSAEADIETVTVPGKNGEVIFSNNRYKNVDVSYPAFIPADLDTNLANLASFLSHDINYMRLSDTYHPDFFRRAYFKGPLNPKIDQLKVATFTLTFSARPEKYLLTGDKKYTFTLNGSIENPSYMPAKPLIQVYGYGTLNVGNYKITIENYDRPYIFIDCEMMNCYYANNVNLNGYVTLANGFPLLEKGVHEIKFSGNITSVIITPRWWVL